MAQVHNVLARLKSDLTLASAELDEIIHSEECNDEFFDCEEDEFHDCMTPAEELNNQPLQTSTENSGESACRK